MFKKNTIFDTYIYICTSLNFLFHITMFCSSCAYYWLNLVVKKTYFIYIWYFYLFEAAISRHCVPFRLLVKLLAPTGVKKPPPPQIVIFIFEPYCNYHLTWLHSILAVCTIGATWLFFTIFYIHLYVIELSISHHCVPFLMCVLLAPPGGFAANWLTPDALSQVQYPST